MSFTTALDQMYKEIEIMKRLTHAGLMRLFEVIDDPSQDKLYLIMPLAEFGESMTFDPSVLRFVPNKKVPTVNLGTDDENTS